MQAVDPGLVLYSGHLSATSAEVKHDALLGGHTLVSVGAQRDTVRRNGDSRSPAPSSCSVSHLFRWLCYSRAFGLHLACWENVLPANSHHPQKHFCGDELQTTHKNPLQDRETALLSHPLVVTLHPSCLRAL